MTSINLAARRRMGAAVRRHRALSRIRALELLFTWALRNMVYPQIWEDPDVVL